MKIANCLVTLEGGNTVPLFGVTPAEVLLLRAMHQKHAKGEPITQLTVIGEMDDHSTQAEMNRLRTKYHKKFIKAVFAGVSPSLPSSFDEAMGASIEDDISNNSPISASTFQAEVERMQAEVKVQLKAM